MNKLFTYGISGDYVHLHLPGELNQMIAQRGMSKTFYTVNLYLLDAIEKIAERKTNGFADFEKCKKIYMLSPILIKKELELLGKLDFDIELHKIKPEDNSDIARLIRAIFESRKDSKGVIKAGAATLDFERINTPEWQAKKAEMVEGFNKRGIFIEKDERTENTPVTGEGEEQEVLT